MWSWLLLNELRALGSVMSAFIAAANFKGVPFRTRYGIERSRQEEELRFCTRVSMTWKNAVGLHAG